MTGIRKRSPTNKEFKTNFQGLAGTRTKKGHLNSQERESDDVSRETGTLIRIHKKKLYEDGWEVQVGTDKDAKTYMCSYQSGVLYIPDSTETDEYYVPKQKTQVEVNIDKKSKIYTIVKINSLNKKPIALFEDNLTISTNTNENTNSDVEASIEVSTKSITLKSDNVVVLDSNDNKIDLVESNKDLNELKKDVSDFKEKNVIEITTLNEEKEKTQNEISNLKETTTIEISNVSQTLTEDINKKVDSSTYNNFISNDYTPLKESVSNSYTKGQVDGLIETQELLFRNALTDFYKKQEIDNLINNIQQSGNQNIDLDDYVKKSDVNLEWDWQSNGYFKLTLDIGE